MFSSCVFLRLFSFGNECCSFLFFLIIGRPNLIVLEFMANGALDKYLQVKSQRLDLHLVRMFVLKVFSLAQRKSRFVEIISFDYIG